MRHSVASFPCCTPPRTAAQFGCFLCCCRVVMQNLIRLRLDSLACAAAPLGWPASGSRSGNRGCASSTPSRREPSSTDRRRMTLRFRHTGQQELCRHRSCGVPARLLQHHSAGRHVVESRSLLFSYHQQPSYSIAASLRILLHPDGMARCSAMGHCCSSDRASCLQLIYTSQTCTNIDLE